MNNLLILVIYGSTCSYDRIVYIVKKGINIFSKKGIFKGGGHNVALVRPWSVSLAEMDAFQPNR